MKTTDLWTFVSAAALAGLVACGGSGTSGAPPAAPAPAPVDPATAATISGKVVLEGEAPAPELIKMSADPFCTTAGHDNQPTQYFVVGESNGLENVFVYVKSGLGSRMFPPPTTPAVLDQQGCRYVPHVVGVQVGQPLDVSNSDDTLHNVHAVPMINAEFNMGQPLKDLKLTHTFTAPEVMVPFKCDVHGWMNAFVGVVDNPYYAVSANGGTFALADLPPGTYEIEAWHEKLGTRTQTVTVGEKESKAISFTFTVTQ